MAKSIQICTDYHSQRWAKKYFRGYSTCWWNWPHNTPEPEVKLQHQHIQHNCTAFFSLLCLMLYIVYQGFKLAKLDLVVWFLAHSDFFATAPAASKNTTQFKSGEKWLKNNTLTSFSKVKFKSLIHTVVYALYKTLLLHSFLLHFIFFLILLLFCFVSTFAAPLRIEVMLQEERIRRLRYQIEEMTRCTFNEARLTCRYKIM